MALFKLKQAFKLLTTAKNLITKPYSLYVPEYLELMKPEFPLYPTINVQIRGYVYPTLEKYQALIDKIADSLDIDVDSSFALPAKIIEVHKYKAFSSTLQVKYKLDLYERNIQLSNITSKRFPIFLRAIEAALPEGVIMNVTDCNVVELDNYRYVPDKQLLDLKEQLSGMQKK